ncbi:MAG: hypothetical protein IPI90_15755 [Saprospiraceae bacterium]|nr:hypothetical protein [Candidatus Vicinibacter affinis]
MNNFQPHPSAEEKAFRQDERIFQCIDRQPASFWFDFVVLTLGCPAKAPYYSKEIKISEEIPTYIQPLEYNWSIQDTYKAYDPILWRAT